MAIERVWLTVAYNFSDWIVQILIISMHGDNHVVITYFVALLNIRIILDLSDPEFMCHNIHIKKLLYNLGHASS